MSARNAAALRELQTIPGIGKSLAQDLWLLGYDSVASLKGADPQKMYDKLMQLTGTHQDRCVLYTFRCAVYYAKTKRPDAEKLKWWNWSDANLAQARAVKSPAPRRPRSAASPAKRPW